MSSEIEGAGSKREFVTPEHCLDWRRMAFLVLKTCFYSIKAVSQGREGVDIHMTDESLWMRPTSKAFRMMEMQSRKHVRSWLEVFLYVYPKIFYDICKAMSNGACVQKELEILGQFNHGMQSTEVCGRKLEAMSSLNHKLENFVSIILPEPGYSDVFLPGVAICTS